MKLDFYKPKNKILQKFMEGYYFISESDKPQSIKYLTFPNNFVIFSVTQNTEVIYESNKVILTKSKKEILATDIILQYNEPLEITYDMAINEVTIYFKPLGINHFIDYDEFFFKESQVKNYFPYSDFKQKMIEILSISNRENQIEELEKYWLSKIRNKDFGILNSILSNIEKDIKIEEIAIKHNISRQYINKLFKRYIGKSPTEFRKIHRFRKSLKNDKDKSLTQVSYDNFFYDQSHFIKDFKKFSNINPSSFFKNVDTNTENIWLFI